MFPKKMISILGLIVFFSHSASAAESLSYSGRLVNTNGSPVTGSVNLKVELAYSGSPSSPICSQNFTSVSLTNGVFHLKVDFDCGTKTLAEVFAEIPANQAASIRVTDVTHSKVYSYQALHAVPFANISDYAKQLVQMAAGDGQVLQWNELHKKWEPGTITVSGGTVTNVSVSSPLIISNPATTPSISISQSNSTINGYLSSADWNVFNNKQPFISAGTNSQYYRGDKTWQTLDTSVVAENVANLYFTNSRALGVPLTGFVVGTNSAIAAGDSVFTAFGKTQGQIDSIKASANNFLVKNSTDSITGSVNVAITGALTITNAPALPTDAANRQYVDTKLSLTGGTLSGALNLDNDLKIKGGANYVTVRGHATSAAYNFILPSSAGTSGQFLQTDGSGNLSWVAQSNTATPSGAAGGDLAGTYPNPTIKTGLDTAKLSAGNVSTTEFDYLDGVTSAIQTQLNGKQATNANLSALSSYSTNGILVQTAANTFTGRSVQGTSNRVSVTNGNGVGGDPTIDIAAGLLPSPIAGDNGKVLKATGANTSAWSSLTSSDITTALTFTPVNKAGDSMSGDLSLGTSKLRFKDSASNYAELKAPATVTTTYALTLPADKAASNGQVLTGDTSGNLTWTTPSSTATPSGAAGGDLAGTYPNPTVKTGLDVAKLSSGVVDNTEFNYLDGVTNTIQTQINGKQASDTTLSSLAIYNANGFVTQIAADTFTGRSIVGTTNRVTIINGNGVSGNPTIDIPTALLPSPVAGDANKFLKATAADTSAWAALSASDVTSALTFTPLNKAGDTMTGDLALTTKLRLRDSTTNYVELKAPTSVTAYTLTLPTAKATVAGQMLTSDTSGNLSWTTPPTSLAPNGAAGGDLSGTYPNPTITALDAAKINTGVVSNAEFNYLDGVTSAIQTQLNGKQAIDTGLTNLAAFNTNGFLVQTAADTFVGRNIVGTAFRVGVTNWDGVAGNPTIDISTALLPSPVAGDAGKFLKASGANTSAWTALSSSDVTTALGFTPINKAGDTISSGTFTYNGSAFLTTLNPINPTDVANKQYVDSFGQWTLSGGDVYRSSGKVGIGGAPGASYKLDVTGSTRINSPSSSVTMFIDRPAGYYGEFKYLTAGSPRWNLYTDAGAEAGSNAGSDFIIQSYNDAGTSLAVPFKIIRSSGDIIMNAKVGIGTGTPLTNLHINTAGNAIGTFQSTFADGTSQLTLDTTGDGSKGRLIFQKSSVTQGSIVYNHAATGAAQTLDFDLAGGTKELTILGSGNVGIGNSSPTFRLTNSSQANIVDQGGMGLGGANSFVWERPSTENINGYTAAFANSYNNAGGHGLLVKTTDTSASNKILVLSSGGTDRVTVLGNGNVGVGLTNPGAPLEVAANNTSIQMRLRRTGTNAGFADIGVDNVKGVGIWPDGYGTTSTNPKFVVMPGGNVGIGTVNPQASLEVAGDTWHGMSSIFVGGDINTYYPLVIGATVRSNNFEFDFELTHGVHEDFSDAGSTYIRLAGNLSGWGSTPGLNYRKQVVQTFWGSGTKLNVDEVVFDPYGDKVIFYVLGGRTYHFRSLTGGTHIYGWYSSAYSYDYGNGYFFNASGPYTTTTGSLNQTNVHGFMNTSVSIGVAKPAYQLQLSTDSAAKPGSSTWTIASDERLKDIRAPFTRGLNDLLGLNTIYFNYKKDNPLELPSDKVFVGIRAQEVKKIIPEAVSTDKDGYLHVTNDSIIWTAVNSIKELYYKVVGHDKQLANQSRQIASKADKKEIEELKAENAKIKQENSAIKVYLCNKDPKASFCK